MARQVLCWISYAYRPLTVEELQCALAVTPFLYTFDEEAMTRESKLVSVCAGLVTIDPESSIIRLVHYTTQEFFEKIRDITFPNAQEDITITCLTYLSFERPKHHDYYYDVVVTDIENSPFIGYAAQNWRAHMRASPRRCYDAFILWILAQPEKVQCIFQAMNELQLFESGIYRDFGMTPLRAAAILGLESVVLLLLERGPKLAQSEMVNSLAAAVFCVQQEVIEILIDHGAPINSRTSSGRTPLGEAAEAGLYVDEKRAVAAARLLLDRGAEVDLQSVCGGRTRSALLDAAQFGCAQVAELLLTYGADVNLRNFSGLTALHFADPKNLDMFEVLIGHGADLHACDDFGNSVLLRVSGFPMEEKERTVQLLLGLGADVRSRNNAGETALTRAAAHGHCRIIRVLMDYGADIRACNALGRSVLLSSIDSDEGQPDVVVPLLLELSADLSCQDSAGDTALSRAAANQLSGTVRLILDHNPNIDTTNEAGDTALTLAAAAEAICKRPMLHNEGDHFITYGKAISVATAMKRNFTIIELLLDHEASDDLKNEAGDTALTLAAAKGKLDAVKLLLNRGADARAINKAGDTALALTTRNGHSEVNQLLLEHQSEPNQPPVPAEVE